MDLIMLRLEEINAKPSMLSWTSKIRHQAKVADLVDKLQHFFQKLKSIDYDTQRNGMSTLMNTYYNAIGKIEVDQNSSPNSTCGWEWIHWGFWKLHICWFQLR